jgi:hypothetical protein
MHEHGTDAVPPSVMREDAADVAPWGGLRSISRRALVVADAARPAAFVIAKVNGRHDELLAGPAANHLRDA